MQLGSCTKEDVQVPERILMTIIKSKAAMYKIYEKEYAEKIQSIEKNGEQAIDNVLEFRNQLSDFLGGEKAFCDFEINVLDK